jgi:hypothetical protein
MVSRNMSLGSACSFLEAAFPFSELPSRYVRFLELFKACGYEPTLEHPLVKEFMDSEEELGSSAIGS